jgi:hypothetical protein
MPGPGVIVEGITIDSQGHIYFGETTEKIVRINDMTGAGEVDFGTLGSGVNQFGGAVLDVKTTI